MLKKYYKWSLIVLLPGWTFVSFISAQLIISGILWLLKQFQVSYNQINSAVLESILAAAIYLLTLLIIVGVPWLVRRARTTLSDIGLKDLPKWSEILIAPAGLVVYVILSGVLMLVASKLIPGFNANQAQDVGFEHLNYHYEYVLAFITLILVAPIVEEIIFRGYLFGKMKRYLPVWLVMLVVSVTFGALHGAWNLAVDTFALSIILCILRQVTDSIWPSIFLHMLKNGIAFYILFINM